MEVLNTYLLNEESLKRGDLQEQSRLAQYLELNNAFSGKCTTLDKQNARLSEVFTII
jgi:hypothetical protein